MNQPERRSRRRKCRRYAVPKLRVAIDPAIEEPASGGIGAQVKRLPDHLDLETMSRRELANELARLGHASDPRAKKKDLRLTLQLALMGGVNGDGG